MRIARNQLRQLIREALEVHLAPEDLDRMSPEEAYGMGYLKGQDMQCDHPDWSPACVHHDSHSDDPDLDDDGFLSVAELVSMVHNMTDDLHEQADRNRDGVLNADELRALADDIEDEKSQGDQFTLDPEMVSRPSSIREPASQDEKADAENAVRKAMEFISSSPHPTFDGLVAYLADSEWYDESYAAEMIEQMIEDGRISANDIKGEEPQMRNVRNWLGY